MTPAGIRPRDRANPFYTLVAYVGLVLGSYVTAVSLFAFAHTLAGTFAALVLGVDMEPALVFIFTAFGIIGLLVPLFNGDTNGATKRFCVMSIAMTIAYAILRSDGYAWADYPIDASMDYLLPKLHVLMNK